MNDIQNINGTDLVQFVESIGCNKRYEFHDYNVIWSIFTGSFFVIPSYPNETLHPSTLKFIISELGITEEAFYNMWSEFLQKNDIK
jgi:hypothetical protein